MTNRFDHPGARLASLAEAPAPASTIDLDRVCRDGHRLRRRRRTGMALTGAATAGVLGVAAVVLPIAHPAGGAGGRPNAVSPQASGPGAGSSPAGGTSPHPTATAPTASTSGRPRIGTGTVTVRVPARFGWLPSGMTLIAEGPSAGSDYGAAAGETAGKQAGQPRIFLTVRDAEQPGAAKLPVQGLGTVAYWGAWNGQTPAPGKADLVWRDASGKWLTLSAGFMSGTDTAAVLMHVASTVSVGGAGLPLPLPIQVKGLPPTDLVLDQAVLDHPAPGQSGASSLTIGLGAGGHGFNIFVKPAGTTQGPWTWGTSVCKDTGGWNVCVVADARSAQVVPGGLTGLLAHIQGLGTDPAGWSADLFVG